MSEDDKRLCLKALEIMERNGIISASTHTILNECVENVYVFRDGRDVPDTNAGKWISPRDRIPENYTKCLVSHLEDCRTVLDVAVYSYGEFAVDTGTEMVYWEPRMIDYWMEVPYWLELPERGSDDGT